MLGDLSYVPPMSGTAPITAEELLHTHLPDKHVELVRGVLVVREPAGYRHGATGTRLTKLLADHVDARGLGRVIAGETGFKLGANPDTVRAPDVAFIRSDRLPDHEPLGYLALPPDLVVEVLSPSDRVGETLSKIGDWLNAGVRLVWVLDPERRVARVYRQDGTVSLVADSETLDGEDVVPGFRCRLGVLLPA
jgi:Uma2 family endonuclease